MSPTILRCYFDRNAFFRNIPVHFVIILLFRMQENINSESLYLDNGDIGCPRYDEKKIICLIAQYMIGRKYNGILMF